jgi:hypothetical protein
MAIIIFAALGDHPGEHGTEAEEGRDQAERRQQETRPAPGRSKDEEAPVDQDVETAKRYGSRRAVA